jgi:hypothetical protein
MAADAGRRNLQRELNHMTPGARDGSLGDCIYDLINNHNALLASLDAAGIAVTGLGTTHVSAFTVLLPEQRHPKLSTV